MPEITTQDGLVFRLVEAPEELAEALELLRPSQVIAIDTETAKPRDPVKLAAFDNIYNRTKSGELAPFDPHTSEVRLVQLRGENTLPVVIDVWKFEEAELAPLKDFFLNWEGTWLGHNLKFDLKMIQGNFGVWLDEKDPEDGHCKIYDTIQASRILGNSVGMGPQRRHGLADNARDFLDLNLDKTEQASDWSVMDLSLEQYEYAALDVVHLHTLKAFYDDTLLVKMGQPIPVDLDMRCVGPMSRLEFRGLPFNIPMYHKVQEAARYAMPALLSRIGKYFQKEIGQPPVLAKVEIEKLDGTVEFRNFYLPWAKGKVGKDFLMSRGGLVKEMLQTMGLVDADGELLESTKKEDLEPLRKDNPGIGYLLDYWMLVKSAQFEYDKYVHPITKRIHASYTWGGAMTGRSTCTSPNLQQTPQKLNLIHPDGTKVSYRKCFMVDFGSAMGDYDWSGQELRIMAALSEDDIMLHTLNNDGDIHSEAAAGMFGIDPKDARQVIPNSNGATYRDRGKTLVFRLAFGSSAEGLASAWKIPVEDAKKQVKGFESRFPKLSAWLGNAGDEAAAMKVCVLPNGAMRFVGGGEARAGASAARRMGSNGRIQGSGSYMARKAIAHLDREIRNEGLAMEINAIVHDEVLTVFYHNPTCQTALFYHGRDAFGEDLKARIKALGKPETDEGKAELKSLENELDNYIKKGLAEACEASGCEKSTCLSHLNSRVGYHMLHAGDEILQGKVSGDYSWALSDHWVH